MRKPILSILGAAALLTATTAQAISLGFDPASPVGPVGSSVDVNLTISGLGDFSPDSLSTFDIDVLYDPAMLALAGAAIGDPLSISGDQLDPLGIGTINSVSSTPGTANLFDLSFDPAIALDTLQPGSFTLATLTFRVSKVSTSPLAFGKMILGDSVGGLFAQPVSAVSANVTAVPEPSTITLFLMGSLVLGAAWRRVSA